MNWYLARVKAGWRRELNRLPKRQNKWVWVALCVIFTVFLLPYFCVEAFTISLLLGLSFLFAAFVAISFGYILRHPGAMIIVFVGSVLGREFFTVILEGIGIAVEGDIIGAVILIIVGIYLLVLANKLKRVEIY